MRRGHLDEVAALLKKYSIDPSTLDQSLQPTVLIDWCKEREKELGIWLDTSDEDAFFEFIKQKWEDNPHLFSDMSSMLYKMKAKCLGSTDASDFGRIYKLADLEVAYKRLMPQVRYRKWLKQNPCAHGFENFNDCEIWPHCLATTGGCGAIKSDK